MNCEIYFGKRGKIEYVDTKTSGDVIVFLHGAGANLNQFDDQIQEFSKDFRVIAPSMAGHGKSRLNIKVTQQNLSFENLALDLIELIDALKISKFHFVGNSAGGVIGLEILKNYSDKLKTLTIFGTAPKINLPNFAAKLINILDLSMLKLARDFYINAIIKYSSKSEYTINKLKYMVMKNDEETIIEFRKVLVNYDYIKELEEARTPLLIIQSEGDKDINKSLKKYKNKFTKKPNIKVVELENAGHVANLDNSEEFNKIVRRFIEDENKN